MAHSTITSILSQILVDALSANQIKVNAEETTSFKAVSAQIGGGGHYGESAISPTPGQTALVSRLQDISDLFNVVDITVVAVTSTNAINVFPRTVTYSCTVAANKLADGTIVSEVGFFNAPTTAHPEGQLIAVKNFPPFIWEGSDMDFSITITL